MTDAGAMTDARERLTSAQVRGFWAAWTGWTLDGMDSFIFALVLAPALTELLPKSGLTGSPANVALVGSVLFAVFLAGWGCSLLWGPIADRWGRTRTLAAAVACYAIFTAAAASAESVFQLGVFRFLAGVGIGGEWSVAGTFVAEAWPESRRKMGAGYLGTGYYVGFFLAAALNFTVGAHFGWRAMFLCGGAPVLVSIYMLSRVREPERWVTAAKSAARGGAEDRAAKGGGAKEGGAMRAIWSGVYRRRTLQNAGLVTVSIIGLWAAAVYEPAAIVTLARRAGRSAQDATRLASFGTGLLSLGTCLGCLLLPPLAERYGRRATQGMYFLGMALSIVCCFGWLFYRDNGLYPFIGSLFVLGIFGGNFAMYNLWLPEQYPTAMRATAFAFVTSIGRFIGAGVNFLIGAGVHAYGSAGVPVASTAAAFVIGLALLPFCVETRGQKLPA